jgi:hypothetical protein
MFISVNKRYRGIETCEFTSCICWIKSYDKNSRIRSGVSINYKKKQKIKILIIKCRFKKVINASLLTKVELPNKTGKIVVLEQGRNNFFRKFLYILYNKCITSLRESTLNSKRNDQIIKMNEG